MLPPAVQLRSWSKGDFELVEVATGARDGRSQRLPSFSPFQGERGYSAQEPSLRLATRDSSGPQLGDIKSVQLGLEEGDRS